MVLLARRYEAAERLRQIHPPHLLRATATHHHVQVCSILSPAAQKSEISPCLQPGSTQTSARRFRHSRIILVMCCRRCFCHRNISLCWWVCWGSSGLMSSRLRLRLCWRWGIRAERRGRGVERKRRSIRVQCCATAGRCMIGVWLRGSRILVLPGVHSSPYYAIRPSRGIRCL